MFAPFVYDKPVGMNFLLLGHRLLVAGCSRPLSPLLVTCSCRAMGDREAIGRTLTLASSLAIGAGAIIAVLFYINSAGLLSLMGAPKEVMGLAVPYLRWRASAFPANLFLLVACGAFRYVGFVV